MNNRGITIVALIITVIVMLILVGVATYAGLDSLELSKRTAFLSEMQLIQGKINVICDKNLDDIDGIQTELR